MFGFLKKKKEVPPPPPEPSYYVFVLGPNKGAHFNDSYNGYDVSFLTDVRGYKLAVQFHRDMAYKLREGDLILCSEALWAPYGHEYFRCGKLLGIVRPEGVIK